MRAKLNRRILCAIGAAVVALSMLVGGVFAWTDNSQHKTNVATGGPEEPNDVVLIDEFDPPDDWPLDGELDKKISVKNTGDGRIFVRLQLKEYMDIAKVEYSYSEDYLLLDGDGRYVAYDTVEELKAWLDANEVVYTDAQLLSYTAYGETTPKYYIKTDGTTNINGRYGKRLLLNYTQHEPESLVPGVVRGSYEETNNHQSHPVSECKYTPHLWYDNPANPDPFHEYIEWTLGTALIKLSDWDGQPVEAWILDDTSEEGWVYWGEALRPGERSSNLMESIKLIKQPKGPFYYAIHVDMQAADILQLQSEFTDMPAKVSDSYRGLTGFHINTSTQSVRQGGTVNFKAAWNSTEVPLGDVAWTVAKVGADHLSLNTKFDVPGILAISEEQPTGTLLVTATYDSPDGEKTQKFVITVRAK